MNRVTHDDASPRPALTDLAFHSLIALGSGPAHGYAIGKDVEEQSGGRLDPSTVALYQALHRLEEEGMIQIGGAAPTVRRSEQVLRADRPAAAGRRDRGAPTSCTAANGAPAEAVPATSLTDALLSLAPVAVPGGVEA
jgi:hypothetical protein